MKTQLPAHTRPTSPCPVVERAFVKLEVLCPFPELLVDEARKLGDCVTSGALQAKRASMLVRNAVAALAAPDLATTGLSRLAAVRGTAAYAATLLQHERWQDATAVAIEVLAESVKLRRGDEDGQRELWEAIIEQVGAVRGMG